MTAFEFKWNNKNASIRFSQTFTDNYPDAQTVVLTPGNPEDYLMQ